ncbi:hypothetical protein [Nocardiopsis composta]|uniref:Uncharacterized protein n=1 Tax=Nocardiopsis composta TaxID=157465 RepID=A0A7W8QPJ6_9ACTN|nr:hypothetical protein [Nocardiopsis composta]MBB5433500.1 hypothetical protein [Nocardiopsis composta]
MRYTVTADVQSPPELFQLDPLQREGVMSLLTGALARAEGMEGPGGLQVLVEDFVVSVRPGGALLTVGVEAPALEAAEEAVRLLCEDLLRRTGAFEEWRLHSCEVQLEEDLARESLAAAEGPDAPPEDIGARRARHAQAAGEDPAALLPGPSPELTAKMAERIRALAPVLAAFGPEWFGHSGEEDSPVGREAADLAAGALVYGTDTFLDELFHDLDILGSEEVTGVDCEAALLQLDRLPEGFAHCYDASFARRFLVTAVAMTGRFTGGGSPELGCTAEELALNLLLEEAETVLDLYGLLSDEVTRALGVFADRIYADTSYEWLYAADPDGAGGVDAWFSPFDPTRRVHPYILNGP